MLQRRPRKGDVLECTSDWIDKPSRTWRPLGTVSHIDGNICWYIKADGSGADSFIWRFDREQQMNVLVRIKEHTDEGVYETTAGIDPVDEETARNEARAT